MDLLGAVPHLLDLWLVDQRPDRHALHPCCTRPRHGGDDLRGPLALIGIFDIIGTVASGWLTDKVDSRYLLFGYYFLRGLSLLVVPALLGPHVQPACFCSSCSTAWTGWRPSRPWWRCASHFGLEKSGVVFGWVFAAHMVGAGVAASYAGLSGRGRRLLHAWIRRGPVPARRRDVPVDPPGARGVGRRPRGRRPGVAPDLTLGSDVG